MNKITYLFFIFFVFFYGLTQGQVTEIFTDYEGYWKSSSTSINSIDPMNSHQLLGFRFNNTVYSTGVNDDLLDQDNVTYVPSNFRAIPFNTLPTAGNDYFVALGQLYDGIDGGVNNASLSEPFQAITQGTQLAEFLTSGKRGLDLGVGIANIPATNAFRFNFSSNGINAAALGGTPDIFVTQIANPSNTLDTARFVDVNGNTVGVPVTFNLNNNSTSPAVATWFADFYELNSTQTGNNFINTKRSLRFAAKDVTDFGITISNIADVVALEYTFSGNSDTAFIAYNAESLSVARQLTVTSQPVESNCDGSMNQDFIVQLQDFNGTNVEQAGFAIKASIETGPGQLLGTVTRITDATGKATFDDLVFEIGDFHSIRFENTSLEPAISDVVNLVGACNSSEWNGSVSTDWNNAANWTTSEIPNANFNVTIPSGLTNYPVLQANAGAKNLTMGADTNIDLNGNIFAVSGDITLGTNAFITGSTAGSNLYFSGTAPQVIPDGFVNGNLDILTIENAQGVTNNSITDIVLTSLLSVVDGNLSTNGKLVLACQFSPRKTAQVGPVGVGGSVSGGVDVEQCFPANRAYRLLTSSVTTTTTIRENWQENAAAYTDDPRPGYGTHITGLDPSINFANIADDGTNGLDYNPSGNRSMFTFNNIGRSWGSVSSTLVPLTAGQPYRLMIRGSRSIDLTSNAAQPNNTKLATFGDLITGPANGGTTLNPNADVFSFFGNPYHAQVDMDAVLDASTNLKKDVFYIWDPAVNANGAYVTIAKSAGNWTNSNTTSFADQYLQPMQAGFVVTDNLGTTPSLNFQESFKEVSQNQMISFSVNEQNNMQLNLYSEDLFLSKETNLDGLKIFFDDNFTLSPEDDFAKLSNDDENMARRNGSSYLSIEQRPYPVSEESLPLFFNNYRHTNYVLEFEMTERVKNFKTFVKDDYLGEMTEITSANMTFSFTVDSSISGSIASDRFSLVFEPVSLSTVEDNLLELSLYPNPSQDNFKIIGQDLGQGAEVEIYNMIGQQVYKRNLNGSSGTEITDFNANAGVYLVKIKTDQGEKTFKLIKE